MADEPVDVLIIGAGASGAALAWSLSETNMKIVCLEQGGWMKQEEYPSNKPDWERYRFGSFSADPNVRQLPHDYPINNAGSPIKPLNFNAVGGSTIVYSAHFPRFHPSDFRVKTLDGVAEDWPIDYWTLEPFFAKNDEIMGVSGLEGNPSYPPKKVPLPPLPIGKIGHTLAKGFNKLGWHWWPADAAIASQDYEGRVKCVNAGPCDLGCAQGAKGTPDVTYWPLAIRRRVELRTHCRVAEITVNDAGMADGVVYFDADGNLQRQKAHVVVLACNGIGTPRLLLNSKSKLFPDGLANSSGLVGKNLMFHPFSVVAGGFGEQMDNWKGPMGVCITSQEFYETDASRGYVRGCTFECVRGVGPMTVAVGPLGSEGVPPGAMRPMMLETLFGTTAAIGIISEDLPEEHNTVTLDPDLKDSNGIPAPKVTYTMSENTQKLLRFSEARAEEVLQAAGAQWTQRGGVPPETGWHLMGTARMGNDPQTSVVNSWGRAHDVKNLFIVDGSIFVTCAAVNPTSTIQALALYIGDQIKKNLDKLFE